MKKHSLIAYSSKNFLKYTACGAILSLIFIAMPIVHAHPHVFIVQRLDVAFDNKGLAGIKVHWEFDDMFASMIAEDHDVNRNGKFEANEIKNIKAKAFSYISEHSYFTFIKINDAPFQVEFIRDFNAILEDKKIIYEFLIPCHVTATSQYKKISIASYDPSYYAAIHFSEHNPFTLSAMDEFEVITTLKEDPDTKIYFDMIHPWTLFMEFRKKT